MPRRNNEVELMYLPMYVCNQAAWVVTDILLQNNDEARTIFGGMHGE